MPAQNAVQLVNWFPLADSVQTRRGYQTHCSGFPGAVETLIPYQPPSGTARLFAASGGGIYDATAAGTVGAALVSGFGNNRWQHTAMTNAAGSFVLAVNGQNTAQLYNGTAWANSTITGPTLSALAWCGTHHRRWWFGEAGSLRAWYLATDAITGAATSFDLGPVAQLGGFIMAMGTWTRDGGSGVDDLAVFLTSEGEVLIYAGTNPASASDWGLRGVFRIGKPLGRRSITRAGADLLIMTQDGFVSLASILPVDRAQQAARSLSAQINPVVTDSARQYGSLFGWQAFLYPRAAMCIFNVPVSGNAFEQYVFNTTTAAPARFTGVPARCWALLNENPYFGSGNTVCLFDTGATDGGAPIEALAIQAFNPFGQAAQKKAFRRVQPILLSEAPPLAGVDVVLDYRITDPLPTLVPLSSAVAMWGNAIWGSSRWAGVATYDAWRGVRGVGRMGALRMRAQTSLAPINWISSNVNVVTGGTL